MPARGHQMTLRQFEFFVEIADTGSFSRAAEAMHVSQPALSQQIRSIESQLGSPLFKRLASGVRLTQAGEAMLPHARAAIASARRAVRAFHEVGAGLSGELELATVMSIAVGVLPKPLARWHAEIPQISVRVSEFAHRRQLEDFTAAGNADLAVGPTPVAWPGPSVPIGQERFVLVTTPQDPVVREIRPYANGAPPGAPRSAGTVDVHALEGRGWVLFDRFHGLSDLIERHLRDAGLAAPRATVRTTQFLTAATLASSGMGPTLLPANVVPDHLDIVQCEPWPPLRRSLSVYSRSEPSGVARRFVDLLRTTAPMLER